MTAYENIQQLKSTRILELNNEDARQFFLKQESYFNFDLPKYFVFDKLLKSITKYIKGKELSDFFSTYFDNEKNKVKSHSPSEFEDVNYKFLNNKDGKFAWRPFQLIHPVLYVSLVNKITEKENWDLIVNRFREFQSDPRIRCYSIPLSSDEKQSDKANLVKQWWEEIEQQSLELALKYEYVLHTDISDCYGSIYTHSISWAIHTREVAKKYKNDKKFLGNLIDKNLRAMAYGQTNGIPQGSVLMDFIAEMVLGYADLELSKKICHKQIQDYEIIRYRDDYRIFSNNPQTIEHITKLLTEVLIDLGMRLNSQKTIISNNVIKDSIKSDKFYWMLARKKTNNIQNHLLLIHNLSELYPNSGSLSKALIKFYDRIKDINETKHNVRVLISIVVDIMYKNPRTYPISSAILSKFLSLIPDINKKNEILDLIIKKFKEIPNIGHLEVWLQRVTIKLNRNREYYEKLCKKVNDCSVKIWNSDWLKDELKNLIESTPIVDEEEINKLDEVISRKEVELFKLEYDFNNIPTE